MPPNATRMDPVTVGDDEVELIISRKKSQRFALFIPCEADLSHGEGSYFKSLAKGLSAYYMRQGYTRCDIIPGTSWDDVSQKLRDAAKADERYERVITIGHGGWDGPILEEGQASRLEDPEIFERFLAAFREGTTPTCKMFVSNCHGGGANRNEEAEFVELRQEDRDALEHAKERQAALEKKLEGANPAVKPKIQASLEKAEEVVKVLEADLVEDWAVWFSHWVLEVAKATGRFAAGPMGSTSTEYTNQHVRAILEGQGIVRQEIFVADGVADTVQVIPARGRLAAAKARPITVEDLTPAPAAAAA